MLANNMTSPPVINISAYKFIALNDIDTLRERLQSACAKLALVGTIILAEEGINIFLAGSRAAIDAIVALLREDARFADLEPKESISSTQPFKRLRVKCKREIITMNTPAVRPAAGRAPAVSAATLKRWLDRGIDDAGRPVVTLDTRNAFEVEHGAFDGALDFRISKFSDFPAAVSAGRDSMLGKTVVTYCTGGIRCEKAAIVMRAAGMNNVYQLDGGILKYFEEVGGAHWRGACFVFDERIALGPQLVPVTIEE